MLKIGDFSKLSLVSIKALRYYDELGLLKPVQVDEFTGYRYYSTSQLTRLNRILALKDMGLALEQIAQLLDQNVTPDQVRGMLKLRHIELEQQVAFIFPSDSPGRRLLIVRDLAAKGPVQRLFAQRHILEQRRGA